MNWRISPKSSEVLQSATASAAAADTDGFLLDPIGNRTKVYARSATATEYEHNPVNEYTKVGANNFEYDHPSLKLRRTGSSFAKASDDERRGQLDQGRRARLLLGL